jgi:hypothetical protein
MYNYLVYLPIIMITCYSCNSIYWRNINRLVSINNSLCIYWGNWRSINKLVSRNNKNKVSIIFYSITMIVKILWISILQYFNNTVISIDKNIYEVSYVINNKLYKFHTCVQRGPVPILQIIDQDDNDVTSRVLPYMGPKYKGHALEPSPYTLKYESLSFELCNGNSYTCKGTEAIFK